MLFGDGFGKVIIKLIKQIVLQIVEDHPIERGNYTESEQEDLEENPGDDDDDDLILKDFVSAVDSFKSKVINSFSNLKQGVKFMTKQLKGLTKAI